MSNAHFHREGGSSNTHEFRIAVPSGLLHGSVLAQAALGNLRPTSQHSHNDKQRPHLLKVTPDRMVLGTHLPRLWGAWQRSRHLVQQFGKHSQVRPTFCRHVSARHDVDTVRRRRTVLALKDVFTAGHAHQHAKHLSAMHQWEGRTGRHMNGTTQTFQLT
jgi:hypothetical protein